MQRCIAGDAQGGVMVRLGRRPDRGAASDIQAQRGKTPAGEENIIRAEQVRGGAGGGGAAAEDGGAASRRHEVLSSAKPPKLNHHKKSAERWKKKNDKGR